MNSTLTFKKCPGVLSFRRGHVISDALMFNQLEIGLTPIEVLRQGILGTQNVNKDIEKDVANPQITEIAKLNHKTDQMVVQFSLAFLPLKECLHAASGTNKEEVNGIVHSIHNFLDRAMTSEGLKEVSRRYARNIANGRWLWRNRSSATSVTINVALSGNNSQKQMHFATFDALKIPKNSFENYNDEEIKLGNEIASQMRGDSYNSFVVKALVTFRTPGSEVFPSQNYLQDKPTGFARSLYKVGHPEVSDNTSICVMGQAAIRDHKIFNAIRTIDTWYPAFEIEGFPIPVEPKGANLEKMEFYRKGSNSAFELFTKLNIIEPNDNNGMFCIAAFERGGVYSKKEENKKTNKIEERDLEEEEI